MPTLKETCLQIEYRLKEIKDRAISPILKLCNCLGISATFASVTSLIFGIAAAISLLISNQLFFVFVALSLLFDLIDGGLARNHKNQDLDHGFWIDFVCDRIVTVSILTVVYFALSDHSAIYLITPLFYLVATSIYAANYRRLILVHGRIPYFLLIPYNHYYASVFFIGINFLNLLSFLIYFVYPSLRKSLS